MPKERPVLMNAFSVQTILSGRKTQTRRVIKPQPSTYTAMTRFNNFLKWKDCINAKLPFALGLLKTHCPYGQIGDHLWVRETWAVPAALNRYKPSQLLDWQPILYRADNFIRGNFETGKDWTGDEFGRWRPSIFMPRWVSRITLEVTDVGVERVQNIREHEVFLEGIEHCLDCDAYILSHRNDEPHEQSDDFIDLWNSINAKRGFGWDTNPWVWKVEFRVIQQCP